MDPVGNDQELADLLYDDDGGADDDASAIMNRGENLTLKEADLRTTPQQHSQSIGDSVPQEEEEKENEGSDDDVESNVPTRDDALWEFSNDSILSAMLSKGLCNSRKFESINDMMKAQNVEWPVVGPPEGWPVHNVLALNLPVRFMKNERSLLGDFDTSSAIGRAYKALFGFFFKALSYNAEIAERRKSKLKPPSSGEDVAKSSSSRKKRGRKRNSRAEHSRSKSDMYDDDDDDNDDDGGINVFSRSKRQDESRRYEKSKYDSEMAQIEQTINGTFSHKLSPSGESVTIPWYSLVVETILRKRRPSDPSNSINAAVSSNVLVPDTITDRIVGYRFIFYIHCKNFDLNLGKNMIQVMSENAQIKNTNAYKKGLEKRRREKTALIAKTQASITRSGDRSPLSNWANLVNDNVPLDVTDVSDVASLASLIKLYYGSQSIIDAERSQDPKLCFINDANSIQDHNLDIRSSANPIHPYRVFNIENAIKYFPILTKSEIPHSSSFKNNGALFCGEANPVVNEAQMKFANYRDQMHRPTSGNIGRYILPYPFLCSSPKYIGNIMKNMWESVPIMNMTLTNIVSNDQIVPQIYPGRLVLSIVDTKTLLERAIADSIKSLGNLHHHQTPPSLGEGGGNDDIPPPPQNPVEAITRAIESISREIAQRHHHSDSSSTSSSSSSSQPPSPLGQQSSSSGDLFLSAPPLGQNDSDGGVPHHHQQPVNLFDLMMNGIGGSNNPGGGDEGFGRNVQDICGVLKNLMIGGDSGEDVDVDVLRQIADSMLRGRQRADSDLAKGVAEISLEEKDGNTLGGGDQLPDSGADKAFGAGDSSFSVKSIIVKRSRTLQLRGANQAKKGAIQHVYSTRTISEVDYRNAIKKFKIAAVTEYWGELMGSRDMPVKDCPWSNAIRSMVDYYAELPVERRWSETDTQFPELSSYANMIIQTDTRYRKAFKLKDGSPSRLLLMLTLSRDSALTFDFGLHINFLLDGEKDTGKSHLLTALEDMCIDGSVQKCSHISKKAMTTDEDIFNDCLLIFHEAPIHMLGVDFTGKQISGDEILKDRLTSNVVNTYRFIQEKDTGAVRCVQYVCRCMGSTIAATNEIIPIDESPVISRMIRTIITKADSEYTAAELMMVSDETVSSSSFRASGVPEDGGYKARVCEKERLIHFYVMVVEKAIEAGAIENVDMTVARVFINRVIEIIESKYNFDRISTRHVEQLIKIARSLTIRWAIHVVYFSEYGRLWRNGTDNTYRDFDPLSLLDIEKRLVCTEEIVAHAFSMLDFHFIPTHQINILKAIKKLKDIKCAASMGDRTIHIRNSSGMMVTIEDKNYYQFPHTDIEGFIGDLYKTMEDKNAYQMPVIGSLLRQLSCKSRTVKNRNNYIINENNLLSEAMTGVGGIGTGVGGGGFGRAAATASSSSSSSSAAVGGETVNGGAASSLGASSLGAMISLKVFKTEDPVGIQNVRSSRKASRICVLKDVVDNIDSSSNVFFAILKEAFTYRYSMNRCLITGFYHTSYEMVYRDKMNNVSVSYTFDRMKELVKANLIKYGYDKNTVDSADKIVEWNEKRIIQKKPPYMDRMTPIGGSHSLDDDWGDPNQSHLIGQVDGMEEDDGLDLDQQQQEHEGDEDDEGSDSGGGDDDALVDQGHQNQPEDMEEDEGMVKYEDIGITKDRMEQVVYPTILELIYIDPTEETRPILIRNPVPNTTVSSIDGINMVRDMQSAIVQKMNQIEMPVTDYKIVDQNYEEIVFRERSRKLGLDSDPFDLPWNHHKLCLEIRNGLDSIYAYNTSVRDYILTEKMEIRKRRAESYTIKFNAARLIMERQKMMAENGGGLIPVDVIFIGSHHTERKQTASSSTGDDAAAKNAAAYKKMLQTYLSLTYSTAPHGIAAAASAAAAARHRAEKGKERMTDDDNNTEGGATARPEIQGAVPLVLKAFEQRLKSQTSSNDITKILGSGIKKKRRGRRREARSRRAGPSIPAIGSANGHWIS